MLLLVQCPRRLMESTTMGSTRVMHLRGRTLPCKCQRPRTWHQPSTLRHTAGVGQLPGQPQQL
jgi:hypothetical protein